MPHQLYVGTPTTTATYNSSCPPSAQRPGAPVNVVSSEDDSSTLQRLNPRLSSDDSQLSGLYRAAGAITTSRAGPRLT